MKAKIQGSILLIIVSCTTVTFSGQLNAQATGYANTLNSYSFDLYHAVKNEKEDFLLSPLSTYYTLLMAYESAENRTKQAFEKVLYIKKPILQKIQYFHPLQKNRIIIPLPMQYGWMRDWK